MAVVTMQDSIDLSQLVEPVEAFAAYVGGHWPDYSAACKKWPHALRKSIAVSADEDADILDVESGDATPGQFPAWFARQKKRGLQLPGVYADASTMPLVQAAAKAIKTIDYVRWVADYDGVAKVPAGMQAKQYTDKGYGRNLDLSVANAAFWSKPSPPLTNQPHYDWFQTGPFPSRYGNLNEQVVVEQYDGARKHALIYKVYLDRVLRPKCQFLAERLAHIAITSPGQDGKPSWGVDRRGWRYQQLAHRAQGQRFV